MSSSSIFPTVQWQDVRDTDLIHTARWRSEAGVLSPLRVVAVDDTLRADTAYRWASEGTALLWQGDFQNARQLLQALTRRLTPSARKVARKARQAEASTPAPAEAFHRYRVQQAQRAHTLGRLLIPFDADHTIPLRRAPEVQEACRLVYGEAGEAYVASLRELLGIIGAYEWRKKGIELPVLGGRIHPHYGVFAPIRSEYVTLVAQAPLPPSTASAFDIGTGTGVLAALLAKRGVKRVIATENTPRALACARDNIMRLALTDRVDVREADLFPEGRVPLIVCNPPWVPAKPSSPLEEAVYDFDSRMLRGFLNGLCAHLTEQGEGWLILSDLAEHLGLRTRETLLALIAGAGLRVIERHDIRPHHPRSTNVDDPLHAARSREVTSLWRLAAV